VAKIDDADADTDTDPTDGVDADPLAFLASLLSVAAVTPPAQTSSGAGACTSDAADDMLSGHARQVALPLADTPISLFPQDTSADTGVDVIAGVTAKPGAAADVATAQKLLSAMLPIAPTDPNAPRSDATQSSDAVTAGLARAAEMLSPGPRHAMAPSHDSIPTPVRDPQWAQDFSARVSLMVRGGESTASLQLSPVDLGPVDVNVVVRDSQATVHFGAAQAETRALIEASIPRLREMLAAQGFNLMDASVSQGFARQARAEVRIPARHDAEADAEVHVTASVAALGLLDTYA
jgi:flagellar hook-length control protein FliK